MKRFAHLCSLTLGLGLAGLFTGCVSSTPRTAQRIEPASDIEVVETSASRPLTSKEMGELRNTVARYLEQQGQTDSGDYYLKVYLTPEAEGVTPEWVVVRFTRYTDTRVAVAASSPAYDFYPYTSYYAYDMYPYGYGSFGRISFQYYDDSFYGSHYYYPRRNHRDRDHGRDRYHRPGDRPPSIGSGQPPGAVVSNPPPRVENPRRRTPDRIAPSNAPRSETFNRPRLENNNLGAENRPATRNPEGNRQWRGRNDSNGGAAAPRVTNPPRAEARNEPRSTTTTPSYRVPDRTPPPSSSSSSDRNDRREARDDGRRGSNQAPP